MKTRFLIFLMLMIIFPIPMTAAVEGKEVIYEKSAKLFGSVYKIAIARKSVLESPRVWKNEQPPLPPKKAERLALDYCRTSFMDLVWRTEQISLINLGEDLWIYRVQLTGLTGGLEPEIPIYILMNGEVVKWEFVSKEETEEQKPKGKKKMGR